MKVSIYFNLHNYMWSVKALEGAQKGRVIGHCKGAWLKNVTPKVSEAGRQRVLAEQKKNVHAVLEGEAITLSGFVQRLPGDFSACTFLSGKSEVAGATSLYYNPYKVPSFTLADDHDEAVDFVGMVCLTRDRRVLGWGVESHSIAASKQLDLFAA